MSTQVVRAACPHDCPDTCGMLVSVKDGVAVKIQGDPSMPFTEGTLCTKVAHYLERTYSPERVLHPLKRTGKRGEGSFRRISWDEALDEIAARLKRIAAEDPQMILPCSYAGTMGMLQYSSNRGSFSAVARVNGRPRRGVVVALSVWWKKFSPDRRNANDVTSQRIADLGGAATFYDCLVEVEKAA